MNQPDQLQQGLYDAKFEHDACGTGFITNIKGKKSHKIIVDALTMLEHMEHRGACGCDPDSGDGAGLMLQIPHEFFLDECMSDALDLREPGNYGVGMMFLPRDSASRKAVRRIIESCANILNLPILGYRKVPVNSEVVGETARSVEPVVKQMFIGKPEHIISNDDFERKLYVLRRLITRTINEELKENGENFYFTSLSSRVIVYKGQLTTYQVRQYYSDLQDERVVSAFGMIHSRFSTNTFPSWKLAQPFRYIAHNGEINTLTGNLNWFYAAVRSYVSPFFTKEEMDMILPVIDNNQSDSACLDNIVEVLMHSGRSLPHVMMMLQILI